MKGLNTITQPKAIKLNSQAGWMKANPNYVYLQKQVPKERITLLQGGTRSGKTFSVIYYIIDFCRTYQNANIEIDICRDTFTALKATAWKDFKDVLNELNIYNQDDHNKTDHIYNLFGNNINYYGADNPSKIHGRSRDILWINEAHQFPEETVDQLFPRTRYRIIADYNPALPVEHWLDNYIDKYPPLITTYRDNPHLTKAQIDDIEAKTANAYWWKVYGEGARSLPLIKSPYLYNFEKEKHVAQCQINDAYPLIFSFDFNVDPFACEVGQIYRDKEGHKVRFVDEITLFDGDVYKMCERIKSKFTTFQLSRALFTGDAMQRKREITQKENIDAWSIIKRELKISTSRLKVPKSNPKVSENRHLCNFILSIHKDFKIDPKCQRLINDAQMVEADESGDIKKKNRNKEEQRADHLDAMRYLLNSFMYDFIERTNKYL